MKLLGSVWVTGNSLWVVSGRCGVDVCSADCCCPFFELTSSSSAKRWAISFLTSSLIDDGSSLRLSPSLVPKYNCLLFFFGDLSLVFLSSRTGGTSNSSEPFFSNPASSSPTFYSTTSQKVSRSDLIPSWTYPLDLFVTSSWICLLFLVEEGGDYLPLSLLPPNAPTILLRSNTFIVFRRFLGSSSRLESFLRILAVILRELLCCSTRFFQTRLLLSVFGVYVGFSPT